MFAMRVRFVLAVTSAAFLSWFVTFAFECYYRGPTTPRSKHSLDDQPPFPNGRADNIFWFLQISDLHISLFDNLRTAKDLTTFCSEVVSVVSPALVLATGDLTHAKLRNEQFSQQLEEEWKTYDGVLRKTGVQEKVPWLDIRGNHDVFNVLHNSDNTNQFLHYSATWRHHSSFSYRYTHHTSFGSYSFLALDACPSPGPKRPFNFFGILHDEDIEGLRLLAAPTESDNQTVWFSHYPSATIVTNHRELRELMSGSVVQVCGHLHTLGGLVTHLYGHHPGGHLELELGDFRFSQRYRLMAFDHDLFSFTDATLGQWPLVLVTTPVDAHFLLPSREPAGRMKHSSHVRILAFSPSPITSVRVWVDGEALPDASAVEGGPLYTSPWNPESFASGLHTIRVTVKDSAEREGSVTQRFALDGTVPPLQLLPELLVLSDLRALFLMLFLFVWLSLLLSLLLSWVNRGHSSFFQPLVTTRSVFYPLMFYFIYFGVGPWYVGEIVTGVYGLVSVHGVQVAGHFLPGSMTYIYGLLMMLTFHIPLTYYLNHVTSHDRGQRPYCSLAYHLLFVFILLLQCGWVRSSLAYGLLPLIASPGVMWPIPVFLFLVFRVFRTRIPRSPT